MGLSVRNLLAAMFRPACTVWLIAMLAGLLAGMWPDAIAPSRADIRAAPLPTLRALAVAQAGWVLLVWPVAIFSRCQRGQKLCPLSLTAEAVGLLILAVPFYIAAGWLADATGPDVARVVLHIASLCPLAWLLGWMQARGRTWRGASRAAGPLIALGPAIAWYIGLEFIAAAPTDGIWLAGPTTFAWSNAASRLGTACPRPLVVWVAWPAVAAVAFGVLRAFGGERTAPPRTRSKRLPDKPNKVRIATCLRRSRTA